MEGAVALMVLQRSLTHAVKEAPHFKQHKFVYQRIVSTQVIVSCPSSF